jgi:hypothetical protein
MPGAQKLRSEAHLQVRRNDKVVAQRRRWTFYETIILDNPLIIGDSIKKAICPPDENQDKSFSYNPGKCHG